MKDMVFTSLDLLVLGWAGDPRKIERACPNCSEETPVTSGQIRNKKKVTCRKCGEPFRIVHDLKKIA
jgi:uncharacterized Zn finger protein